MYFQHETLYQRNEWMLQGATPYTKYTISVKSKPLSGGLWSDTTDVTLTTPSDGEIFLHQFFSWGGVELKIVYSRSFTYGGINIK